MNILYYNCFSGISGDMHLAAMIDLGVPVEYIEKELSNLPLGGYNLEVQEALQNGINGTRVNVRLHQQEHHHRTFKVIKDMITSSSLSDTVKQLSINIFLKIAKAEAKIHGKTINEVHFHEVGAIDSIVDIVGAAICIDYLKPGKIICSPVELGSGFARCAHGNYPVPAPATAEILEDIPVSTGNQPFEATTPTGAAIIATVVNKFSDQNNFTIKKTAYGIGHKKGEIPNVLRILSGESFQESNTIKSKLVTEDVNTTGSPNHLLIECNIDDMPPETIAFVMDRLLEEGADDVFITPIIMKKSRNGSKISILCNEQVHQGLVELVFRETSTFGIRSFPVKKTILKRDIKHIETKYGKVRVKIGYSGNQAIKHKAEYDDCMELARKFNVPLKDIYREVEKILISKF